jgi:hypothetical protein
MSGIVIGRRLIAYFRHLALGVLLGVAFVYSPNGMTRPVSASSALAVCQEALSGAAGEYAEDMAVYRAEESTVALVASWQEQRLMNSGIRIVSTLRVRSALDPVAVCLYTGTFVTPVGPGVPRHDLLTLLVFPNGEIVLDSAGHLGRASKAETPSDLFGQALVVQ